MSDPLPDRLTPLEARIMDCVWDLGEATARQVKERLAATRPMAYTTVQTMMALLRDKGFLTSRRQGRADVYVPLVDRQAMGRRRLREVMDQFFSGSAAALVSHLVDLDGVGKEEIEAMRRTVGACEREK
ncbi:MAG: BlaI/MecI/CopY family transcriptional regulator [Gemmatimonadota bacterium]